MFRRITTTLSRRGKPRAQALRVLLAMLVTLALAGGAGASPLPHDNGGIWVEICGGVDGSHLVQLDGNGNPVGDDCTHCSLCFVATGAAGGLLLSPQPLPLRGAGPVSASVDFRTVMVTGAAQFWAAGRGPPIASEINDMTNIRYLAPVAGTWGTPWS